MRAENSGHRCDKNWRQHITLTNLLRIRAMLLQVFESLSKTCNVLQHCKYRKKLSATGCYTRTIFRATSYHCKLALQVDRCNTLRIRSIEPFDAICEGPTRVFTRAWKFKSHSVKRRTLLGEDCPFMICQVVSEVVSGQSEAGLGCLRPIKGELDCFRKLVSVVSWRGTPPRGDPWVATEENRILAVLSHELWTQKETLEQLRRRWNYFCAYFFQNFRKLPWIRHCITINNMMRLRKVLNHCCECNLMLNRDKCWFCLSEVSHVGRVLSTNCNHQSASTEIFQLCKLLSQGVLLTLWNPGKYDTLFENICFDLGPCSILDLKYQ